DSAAESKQESQAGMPVLHNQAGMPPTCWLPPGRLGFSGVQPASIRVTINCRGGHLGGKGSVPSWRGTIILLQEVLPMKHFVFGLAVCAMVGLAGLSPGVWAQEPAKQEKADPAKELAAIQKDWNAAQQAFYKAYGEAKTDEERQKVLKEKRPKPEEF